MSAVFALPMRSANEPLPELFELFEPPDLFVAPGRVNPFDELEPHAPSARTSIDVAAMVAGSRFDIMGGLYADGGGFALALPGGLRVGVDSEIEEPVGLVADLDPGIGEGHVPVAAA